MNYDGERQRRVDGFARGLVIVRNIEIIVEPKINACTRCLYKLNEFVNLSQIRYEHFFFSFSKWEIFTRALEERLRELRISIED